MYKSVTASKGVLEGLLERMVVVFWVHSRHAELTINYEGNVYSN